MKRLFLFAAIMLSVQVSAQSLSKEEATRQEEQRVAKAILALKKYAVNDTIKISIQDIERLAANTSEIEVDRLLTGIETRYLYDWGTEEQKQLAEIALSFHGLPREMSERSGASFIIDVINKYESKYYIKNYGSKYDHDISEGWNAVALEDSLVNFLSYMYYPIISIYSDQYIYQQPINFQECNKDRYIPSEGDIIVYDLGNGEYHFAIAISETEIIHDAGNGVVIEKKENYDKYEKVFWVKQFWGDINSHTRAKHYTSEVKVLLDREDKASQNELKTRDVLNAIMEVLY
jgi:hypothetical protein